MLGLAAKLLPGVRIIRSLRDPRDIAISCYMQDFGNAHPYRSTFESLADELIRHQQVFERWTAQTNLALHQTVLEELTADPEPRARALIEFLGLEWDDACLRFHESGSHVKTASVDQIRSGINTKGHGRWKNYQSQLEPMTTRLAELLDR